MDFWKELLRRGLGDDGWEWDWTSLGSLGKKGSRAVRARVVAKSDGVWASTGLAAQAMALSRELGAPVAIRSALADGARLEPGQVACRWSGPARMVLALERPFLNLASYAGGIAFATRRLADEVARAWKARRAAGPPPRVTSTRKILPGYRDLAIHAVIAGGGHPHRLTLSGGVLIKENHIAAAGGIRAAVEGARARAPHLLRVEVEVRDLAELRQALAAQADVIMLDNFSPAQAGAAAALLRKEGSRALIEASGGITESNIGEYAIPGIHVISSGALTHSVRSIDLSLLVERA